MSPKHKLSSNITGLTTSERDITLKWYSEESLDKVVTLAIVVFLHKFSSLPVNPLIRCMITLNRTIYLDLFFRCTVGLVAIVSFRQLV